MKRLKEAEVQDSDGRVIISPGLKVRHKESQFEYTVDSVVKDDKGEHVVVLNLPEEPRFDAPEPDDVVITDMSDKDVIYEVDPNVVLFEPEQAESVPEQGLDYLAVSEDEFEKEYEVK